MGHSIRFIVAEERPVGLGEIEAALRLVDGRYHIRVATEFLTRAVGGDQPRGGGRALDEILDDMLAPEAASPVRPDEGEIGDLWHADEVIGEIEVNRRGEALFEEEVEELRRLAAGAGRPAEPRVQATLARATAIVLVRVQWGDRPIDETLARLGPLRDWLGGSHDGLVHADGEGFYEGGRLILDE